MDQQDVVTVVLADDHAPTRESLRRALEADGVVVVAEASTAASAVTATRDHRPDVALLDVHMPGGGVSAAATIAQDLPATTVVMLSYSRDESDLFDSLRAGARGYLVKDMDLERLGQALRGVLAGEASLPRSLMTKVIDEFRSRPQRRIHLPGRKPMELTKREWEIVDLLHRGLSTEEVAARLYVAPGTVRVHVSSVLRKLQVGDRESALRLLRGQPDG